MMPGIAPDAGGLPSMDSVWAFLRAPAIHVAVARDAFVFDISWLGIVLVLGVLLLFRHLRR